MMIDTHTNQEAIMSTANLFEYETTPERPALNAIWDRMPETLGCSAMEAEFIRRAVAAGFTEECAEGYLLGDPSC